MPMLDYTQIAPRRLVRKHPHERGEDIKKRLRLCVVVETPPRAWGRPRHIAAQAALNGNTPTSVGKTIGLKNYAMTLEKHPHERGEDQALMITAGFGSETPPRAWGRPKSS